MANNQVEEVKSKIDIVSLISEYIEVKKAGRNYKANCPFHGEKTPSFMITPELQMYKCFGCGKAGDVFTFLEEHEGMEFKEALKYLADKVGITLTNFKGEETSEKEKILEVNKNALYFYNYALNTHSDGKKILEYLKNERKLNDESIKLFKLGYSPESFTALSNYLVEKKKIKIQDITLSGLLVGRGIDRFRGRVIFPLFDHRDNLVGFAGRVLPWGIKDAAKYINSPDTQAYHKSKILYGLNVTKSEIRNKKYAIIVEGELDMISSYQAGIKNVVAIKGSALTEDQIRLLGRFCQKIVLCLDSDFAGDEAAKRGAILAVNMDFEVKVAHLSGYKDPDEIAKADPDSYKKAIEEAVDIWEFLIDAIFNKYDSSTGDGKSSISKEVIPLLNMITDKIVQYSYAEKVARRLSVPVEIVISELSKDKKQLISKDDKQLSITEEKSRRLMLEEKLLVNCLTTDKKYLFKQEVKELISSEFILKIINFIEKNDFPLPVELQNRYAEMLLSNSEKDNIELITKELTTLVIRQKLELIGEQLKKEEDNKDLLKEFDFLSKKLSAL